MIYNENVKVISNNEIAKNIYEAVLASPNISSLAQAGQFINILPSSKWNNVMRRPMSIAWQKDGEISIIYKVFGEGTEIISEWLPGDSIDVLGPLGNKWSGFEEKKPIIIGGGVGIAPILNLHKYLKKCHIDHITIMGAKYKEEHFMEHNPDKNIYLSTDLDDYGYKGNVISALDKILLNNVDPIKIFTCGPPGMMKGIVDYSNKNNIDCDLALEAIMACGIGICQGCTIVKKIDTNNTYRNKYALACVDGPIFNIKELDNAFL